MRRIGVTQPITAFACAVTQFLTSTDLQQLQQVSRQDLRSTTKIWNESEALLVAVTKKSTGTRTNNGLDTGCGGSCLLHVLRHPDQPQQRDWCVAYAWSQAIRVVERCVDQCIACVWINFGVNHHRLDVSPADFIQIHLSKTLRDDRSMIEVMHRHGGVPHPLDAWIQGVLAPLDPVHEYYFSNVRATLTRHQAVVFLLELFQCFGEQLNFVYITNPREAASVIPLWFDLGIAPRLPLEMRVIREFVTEARLDYNVRQLDVFGQYESHIDVTVLV
jgi:hypothetical protein